MVGAEYEHSKNIFRRIRRRIIIAAVIVLVVLIAAGGFTAWAIAKNARTDIDANAYQAIFLTNGQVYFGKLETMDGGRMKLSDVFYLQKSGSNDSANPQAAGETGDVQLIKLGSEVHGPRDEMILTGSNVLYYENLKPDSSVSKTMDNYKGSKQ